LIVASLRGVAPARFAADAIYEAVESGATIVMDEADGASIRKAARAAASAKARRSK